MAETDILNPQQYYWPAIGDNPNPSYGFTRKVNSNSQLAKTRRGNWYQRENANDGYAFAMSFMNRPYSMMLRLKQFYEIGKSGYFTYIDYDGGQRHHVGRFTSQPNPTQVANGKYNCQNLIFEEIPQARMLQYPSNLYSWSRTINVVDDFLSNNCAFQGTGWTLQQSPYLLATEFPMPSVNAPSSYELFTATPAAGDFAQIQYVGWGFQLSFRPPGTNIGTFDLYVDGALVASRVDLFGGNCANIYPYTPPVAGLSTATSPFALPIFAPGSFGLTGSPTGSLSTFFMPSMPLDTHRVKIVARAEQGGTPPVVGLPPPPPGSGGADPRSGGTSVFFPAIQVIV